MYNQYINSYSRPQNGINWVQGIEGAKAFQMMPGSNIVLMDSENENIFYIKVCDNVGMCSLRTFKYEELQNFHKNEVQNVDFSQFVTKDELSEMLNSLNLGGNKNGKQPVQSIKPNSNDNSRQ